MADYKYFAAIDGQAVELGRIQHDGSARSRAANFSGTTPGGVRMACERMVEMKKNPSRHACDGRCVHAKGFLCECSCGGRNHGAGDADRKAA